MATEFDWATGLTTLDTGGNYEDMVWAPGAGCFVATFTDGAATHVARSVDGVIWTKHALPAGGSWRHLAWSEPLGLFCIVASNQVATSPDGITWTAQAYGFSWTNPSAIIWAGGSIQKFVVSGAVPGSAGEGTTGISLRLFGKANLGGTTPRTLNTGLLPGMTNAAMFVGIIGGTTDTITAPTLAGNAMTFIDKIQIPGGGRWIYLYWRAMGNPASASQALVINSSPAGIATEVYYNIYEGCHQTTQPDAKVLTSNTSAAMTAALLSTVDDTMMVMFGATPGGNVTAGANTTIRNFNGGAGGVWADRNKVAYPVATVTLTANITAGSSAWASIGFTINPAKRTAFITSPDGVTWTKQLQQFHHGYSTLRWSEELGLIVAGTGTVGFPKITGQDDRNALTSPDAVNWTIRPFPSSNVQWPDSGHCRLTWADTLGLFVGTVITEIGEYSVATSPDGINWTVTVLPTDPIFGSDAKGIVWCNRPVGTPFFLIYGEDWEGSPGFPSTARWLWYSEDGVTWELLDPPGMEYDVSIGYGDWFVAAYSPELDLVSFLSEFDETWLTAIPEVAAEEEQFEFDPDKLTSIGLVWVEGYLPD